MYMQVSDRPFATTAPDPSAAPGPVVAAEVAPVTSPVISPRKLVRVSSRVVHVRLTPRALQVIFHASVWPSSKQPVQIANPHLCIDTRIAVPINVPLGAKPRSRWQKLRDLRRVTIPLGDLLGHEDTPINSSLKLRVDLDGVPAFFNLHMPWPRVKDPRLRYAPLCARYVGDWAIHLRRTNAGTPVLVRRQAEPMEQNWRFRLLESRPVTAGLAAAGAIARAVSPRRVNIYYEKFARQAEEGAYEVFARARLSGRTRNHFILDRDSPDWTAVAPGGGVVAKYSLRAYWLLFRCNYILATESPAHFTVLRTNSKHVKRRLVTVPYVLLQHGVTYLKPQGRNSSFIVGRDAEPTFVVTGSEAEQQAVSGMLRLPSNRVLITGLPIFDTIRHNHINAESPDIITVMVTWRPSDEHVCDFRQTRYHAVLRDMLSCLREAGLEQQIQIVAHPKVSAVAKELSLDAILWKGSVRDALARTKLLITDYSSVCYNAFYQGAGVIFYQPDLEEYEASNGRLIPGDDEYIGPRCLDHAALAGALEDCIRDGAVLLDGLRDSRYEARYRRINAFHDTDNVERIIQRLAARGVV